MVNEMDDASRARAVNAPWLIRAAASAAAASAGFREPAGSGMKARSAAGAAVSVPESSGEPVAQRSDGGPPDGVNATGQPLTDPPSTTWRSGSTHASAPGPGPRPVAALHTSTGHGSVTRSGTRASAAGLA